MSQITVVRGGKEERKSHSKFLRAIDNQNIAVTLRANFTLAGMIGSDLEKGRLK